MSSAASLYSSVISDVISSIRESFLDEAVDEQVLQELKTLWEQKLAQSKTVDPNNGCQEALLDAKMAVGRSAGKFDKDFILCVQIYIIQDRSPLFDLLLLYIVVGPTATVRGVTTGLACDTGNTQMNGNDDNSSSGGGAGASAPQLVITNPDRLVPVQITIPAQPGNPASVPRTLIVLKFL